MTQRRETPEAPQIAWTRWYRLAREDMAFRYGIRGIPVDAYKEQFALGANIQQGVKAIVQNKGLQCGDRP